MSMLTVALGIAVAAVAAESPDSDEAGTVINFRLIPATKYGEPWLAVSDQPAREFLDTGDIPALRLSITDVRVTDGRNMSVKVFVNTTAVSAASRTDTPHFVTQAYFTPGNDRFASFDFDASRALINLDKASLLRRDRPLIFAIILAPAIEGRAFKFKDWTVTKATLTIKK